MQNTPTPAPRRDKERERLERQVKNAKFQFNFASYFALATALTAGFMATSMDDGERLDLHKMVKDKPEHHQLATEYENKILLACGFFSLLGGVNCHYRQRKVRKAQEALDNYAPGQPKGP